MLSYTINEAGEIYDDAQHYLGFVDVTDLLGNYMVEAKDDSIVFEPEDEERFFRWTELAIVCTQPVSFAAGPEYQFDPMVQADDSYVVLTLQAPQAANKEWDVIQSTIEQDLKEFSGLHENDFLWKEWFFRCYWFPTTGLTRNQVVAMCRRIGTALHNSCHWI